jgi:hypothetical protein
MAHRLRHTHSVEDITAGQAYGLGLLSLVIAVLGVAALVYVLL